MTFLEVLVLVLEELFMQLVSFFQSAKALREQEVAAMVRDSLQSIIIIAFND